LWDVRDDGSVLVWDKNRYRVLDGESGRIIFDLKNVKEALAIRAGERAVVITKNGMACHGDAGKSLVWKVKTKPSPSGRFGVELLESILVYPTAKEGLLGISVADGSVRWTVDVKGDLVPHFSPSNRQVVIEIPKKKELHVVNLVDAPPGP
jgi:hypothetical protein